MGAGSVATELQVQIFQAVQAGEWDAAAKLNEQLEPLMEVIFGPPIRDYRARAKEALRLLGRFPGSGVREPLLPVDYRETQAIASGLKLAGLV
jgi:dihydrodipicolinate synthase/N-acetylneuraminate lyase